MKLLQTPSSLLQNVEIFFRGVGVCVGVCVCVCVCVCSRALFDPHGL